MSVCEGTVPYGACPEDVRSKVCSCEWNVETERCALSEEDTGDDSGPSIGMVGYIVAGVVGALFIIIGCACYWIRRESGFQTRDGNMIKRVIGFRRKFSGPETTRRISLETVSDTHMSYTGSPRSAVSQEFTPGRRRISSEEGSTPAHAHRSKPSRPRMPSREQLRQQHSNNQQQHHQQHYQHQQPMPQPDFYGRKSSTEPYES
eukprot:CAMPEP_0202830498 /NCGR_PEP_ID=MMETSP1389-20130828/16204_1 /ASSEMBLY_ACC=CAM_ASM_000865 /TAXON_ID=302021 /ORGANISM="Rhodomonas sp., Strain CCMP768" /LENGTH=203 /DNA_ID=CAMNT_0049504149 /DNA_START=50 /DNA_END=658 /DNA_ORIENTATION=+